jgi:DNA-binding NarL/FixJ family response regulator
MTEPSTCSVFIVEDHPIVRRGLVDLVGGHYDVVGSADGASAAIEMITERWPDLILLDVHFSGGGGEAVAKAVRKVIPEVKILCFTVSTSRPDVARMFNAGVDGYIVKSSEEHELLDAIEETLANRRPVSREVAGFLLDIDADTPAAGGFEKLTPREREVVELIARGYTYKETASSLGMAVKTLENHMGSIFGKLNAQSRHEVTSSAYQHGFLRPDDRVDPASDEVDTG